MVMGIFFNEQAQTLKEKNDTLQAEKKQLAAINAQLEMEKSYINTQKMSNNNKEVSFKKWTQLDKVAERMVTESEGNFNKSWALYLVREAEKYQIDPYLVYELLKVETGGTFDPELVGPETKYGRAYGMAQFMKNTAPWIAEMGGLPYDDELLFDPYYSMQLSLIYLDYLHHKYGNWNEALTAYHRGVGGLETYISNNGHAKSWYAEEIQANAKTHESYAVVN